MGGGGGYKPINQSSHKLKKIMIIEKVFSNIEKESEKLYSILLSEDEADLFSEFQKEFNSKSQPKEKKETKLKFGDRLIIRGYKNRGQDYRDEARETWKTGKMGKQQRKGMVAGFVGVNAARSLGKSIENNIIYPRETFMCSNCLARDICKSWTGSEGGEIEWAKEYI